MQIGANCEGEPCIESASTAAQRQTTVIAHLKSRQLPLFAITLQSRAARHCNGANDEHYSGQKTITQYLTLWPSPVLCFLQEQSIPIPLYCINVVLMLGQRLRRWPNIKTTSIQCLVFAGVGTNLNGQKLSTPLPGAYGMLSRPLVFYYNPGYLGIGQGLPIIERCPGWRT